VSGGEHRRINPATYIVDSRDLAADIDLAALPGALHTGCRTSPPVLPSPLHTKLFD
jgi:hypothetical protein